MNDHLMNTYARLPLAFERGEGAWLWDENGRRYLDAISGLGVTALGHAHPQIAEVISSQSQLLMHTSNLVRIPWQEKLADRLAEISGLERSFICNSGTEAIECAVKIARLSGHEKGYENPSVIVMENSFHGRSLAALSATGSRKVQAGFEPLVSGFVRVPFNDLNAVKKSASGASQVTAILVEPIQGEAGVCVPDQGYLAALRRICDQQGWLLIFDEIQSGLCRSGRWYAHQFEAALPDVLTTAKALANGFPIGACTARGEAAELMTPGRHGSTFGGNPLACRTACAVLDIMKDQDLAKRSERLGREIRSALSQRIGDHPAVMEIRGKGLMMAIELDRDVSELSSRALDKGLLINVTQNKVIRLLPPLIITREQAEEIAATVSSLVESL
jgi:acetylornithine/N-succinyldiaminopimelate aminotransferase